MLPSRNLKTQRAGVFWPTKADTPATRLVTASDHRMVWVDIKVKENDMLNRASRIFLILLTIFCQCCGNRQATLFGRTQSRLSDGFPQGYARLAIAYYPNHEREHTHATTMWTCLIFKAMKLPRTFLQITCIIEASSGP